MFKVDVHLQQTCIYISVSVNFNARWLLPVSSAVHHHGAQDKKSTNQLKDLENIVTK